MKAKTLIILAALCGILAAVAYFTILQDDKAVKETVMGKELFADMPVNDIHAIGFTHANEKIMLKKKDVWVVENRYDYPADFGKITEFVKKVKDLKIGRQFPAKDDSVSRLGLRKPDEAEASDSQKGVRVELKDKTGKKLSDVIIGKERESDKGSGGQYIMPAESETIYLVDKGFKYTNEKPSDWLLKDIIKVPAKDIETVVCQDLSADSPVYSLKRPEKDKDPEFEGNAPEEEGKLLKYKINSLFGALASLQLEDVADPAKDAAELGFDKYRFAFKNADGTVYTVYPGAATDDTSEKYYLKVEVGYTEPEPVEAAAEAETSETGKSEEAEDTASEKTTEAEKSGDTASGETSETEKSEEVEVTASGETVEDKKVEIMPPDAEVAADEKDKAPEKSPADLKVEAEELNKKIGSWVYIVSKWRQDDFITDTAEFFEKPKADDKQPGNMPAMNMPELNMPGLKPAN